MQMEVPHLQGTSYRIWSPLADGVALIHGVSGLKLPPYRTPLNAAGEWFSPLIA
jgi:hypothetical protein